MVSQICTFDSHLRQNSNSISTILPLLLTLLKYYEQMTMVFSELGNLLLQKCASFLFEQNVLSELLGCFRNFTRQAPKLTFINRQYISVLIKLVKMPPNDKIQAQAIQCI